MYLRQSEVKEQREEAEGWSDMSWQGTDRGEATLWEEKQNVSRTSSLRVEFSPGACREEISY